MLLTTRSNTLICSRARALGLPVSRLPYCARAQSGARGFVCTLDPGVAVVKMPRASRSRSIT